MKKTLGASLLEVLTTPHSPADLFGALAFVRAEPAIPDAPVAANRLSGDSQVFVARPQGSGPDTQTNPVVRFTTSDVEVELSEGQTLLSAAEEAGLKPLTGCRRGVCHRCVRPLTSGVTRNSRDSTVGGPGDSVRICVSTAISDVEVDL